MRRCGSRFVLGCLLLAIARPAAALDGFDFAVERLEVIGSGAFVDEFDDGLRDVAPTARLVDRGGSHTTESGGVLRLTDRDGAQGADAPQRLAFLPSHQERWFEDRVSLTQPIVAGSGATEVRARMRVDVPAPFARYGLAYRDSAFSPTYAFFPSPYDVVVERSPNGLLSIAGSEVHPAQIDGGLVLRLTVADAPPPAAAGSVVIVGGFSIDGGTTFVDAFTTTPFQPVGGRIFPVVFGGGPVDSSLYAAAEAGDLVRGPGGALQAFSAPLFDQGAPGSPITPIGGARPGVIELAAAGAGDLRATPGSVTIAFPDGEIAGTPVRVNEVRRVDIATGRPVAADATGASCTSGAEPDCWTPGRPIAQNQRVFDEICRWSVGYSAIDRSVCALDVYRSSTIAGGLAPISTILSLVLGGNPIFTPPILIALSGATGFQLALNIGPADGAGLAANGLAQSLTDPQEALLGCGPFFGTACEGPATPGGPSGGVSLLHSEATALFQSFLGLDGTDDTWLANDGTRTQPGTVPLPGGPVFEDPCTRFDGAQAVSLPGCRRPGAPSYDPAIDGATTALLHPHTGSPFVSEMAAFSFNFQGIQTAFSTPDADGGLVPNTSRFYANEPDEFDEFDKLRTNGCSYYAPSLCRSQRAMRDLTVRELADDPSGPPARRWVWETGAEYAVTSATGRFAAFAGGRIHVLGPAEPRLPGYAAGASVLLEPGPLPDADADGVADANDTCPHAANPDQSDLGGVGAGSAPDGIGDACQCGDLNGDGRVTAADVVVVTRSILSPPTAVPARPDLCDVGGSAGCSVADAVTLRRALLSPPTATIAQSCAPANP